jgi:hypothetical protein
MFTLDNTLTNPPSRPRLLEIPSFESTDPDYTHGLIRLKQHLSVCLQALQALEKWGPRLEQKGIEGLWRHNPQRIVDELVNSPRGSYSDVILDLFRDQTNFSQISSSEALAGRVFSLLLQVPWQEWNPVGITTDELAFLHDNRWIGLPREWQEWIPAICVLDREGKWRLHDKKFSRKNLQKDVCESVTDSGVKFEQRKEHFCCGEPPISRMERTPLSDDMALREFIIEPSEGATKAEEPVDWRGEHFLWSAGGNCCA